MIEMKKECCEIFPVIVPHHSSLKSVNFYLVKQDQTLSLIDAGWNNQECWDELLNTLYKNGFSLTDLTEIILTHHHDDHIGLVNRITSEHPIPVYAHPDSIPRLKRNKDFLDMMIDFFSQLYKEMGCGEMGEKQIASLKKYFYSNENRALHAELVEITDHQLLNFDVIEIPGHSPDQLAFYDQKQNWMFSGDLVLNHISSNALVEPDRFGKRIHTLSQHIHSLKKCLSLNVNLIFPGHGILIENPGPVILKKLERMKTKAERLIHLIESGMTTGSQIAHAYYKNKYFEQFGLVMSEIIGHLDHLESQGKIKKDLVKGIWNYSITGN